MATEELNPTFTPRAAPQRRMLKEKFCPRMENGGDWESS